MEALSAAAAAAGIPVGSQRFLAATVGCPLLGAALGAVPGKSPTPRHVASLALGLALCVFVYGLPSTLLLLAPVAACYALMAASQRHAGTAVYVFAFAYLLVCHVRTASGAAWKEGNIDFTGTLMVFTLKLVATALDFSDGAKPVGDGHPPLTPHQQACRLARLPSVLEFLAYLFFPCTLLAGPWMPLADYLAYAKHTGVRHQHARMRKFALTIRPPITQVWATPRPSGVLPALQRCAVGLVCAGIHAVFSPMVPETAFLDAAWLAAHPGRGPRLLYMWAMAFTARCKYYFAWTWAHAACITSGLSWGGYDVETKRPDWSRASNIDILGVEFATSAAALPITWNTRTGLWLRHYSYERLAPPHRGRAPFWALLATQAVSGVWHGVQPGYALFFVSSSFMFHASKVLFRAQRSLKGTALTVSTLLHGLLTSMHLSYTAAVFIAITMPAGWAAWKAVSFVGHASMFSICLLGALMPPARAPKPKTAVPEANGRVTPPARRGAKKLA